MHLFLYQTDSAVFEDPIPWFWFSLLKIVLALELALLVALFLRGVILLPTPGRNIPVGDGHSGSKERLVQSSVDLLFLRRQQYIP